MSLKITSPAASFIQFGDVDVQPFQNQANIPLKEEAKWNVAFQFSIIDDETGYLDPSTVVKAAICAFDGTYLLSLGNATPLYTRTHILFNQDSVNLVTLIVGSTGKTFNRLVTRQELLDALIDMGLEAYDKGTYIWYKEYSPADITINYLDEDNINQQMEIAKFLDSLFVDVETNMTDAVAVGACYRYGIVKADNTVIAVSNAFKRVTGETYNSLIRYRNEEDSMGFVFSTSDLVYNRVSVPLYISKPQYPSQRKVYKKSNGTTVVLSASLDKEWPVETDWMPDWLHQALTVAIESDTFEMYIKGAWKKLVPNGEYKIDWSDDTYDSGQATSKVLEKVYNYKNDNSGNELPLCLPPYVKLVSVTAELATFELYPNINCQNFDFRFRQSGTVDWSVIIPINIAGYLPYQKTLDLTPYPYTAFEYQFRSRCANGETSEWGYVHSFGTDSCNPVFIVSGEGLPDAEVGVAYSHSITLGGDAPFALSSIAKPSWMTITLTGGVITFTGTPDVAGTAVGVDFNITNCTGANVLPFSDPIDVAAPPTPGTGTVELDLTACGGASLAIKDADNVVHTLVAGDCTGSIELPYGTYRINSLLYLSCTTGGGSAEVIPDLGTYFTLDASNPTQLITINCIV